jgi:hypothetical protein
MRAADVTDSDEFEDAYRRWMGDWHLEGSADDEIDDLYGDVNLADTWVAEVVVPYVARGVYRPAGIDVVSRVTELMRRADDLAERRTGSDRAKVMRYREYIAVLLALHAALEKRAVAQ